ncbi:AraJ Arabinose efflux permease [Rhabdaerophilaceae bacterium]
MSKPGAVPPTLEQAQPGAPRFLGKNGLGAGVQRLTIALTAFLTLIDLFAVQAILPSLATRYAVSPAQIGAAANACTLGMAVASLATALLSQRIDRRLGIALSLALLSIPTAALAFVQDLTLFTILRIAQGALMASAFTLMLAYLGEHFTRSESATAFAAFVTGNVLSNLAGRMMSASLAGSFGLEATFLSFSLLNLLGAGLVAITVARAERSGTPQKSASAGLSALRRHLANSELRKSFLIGFLILFVFIGVFTYVNFVLVAPPLGLGMMQLGLVYLVFLPSMVTTLVAGKVALMIGVRRSLWLFLGLACIGLPLLLAGSLIPVLAGLTLVAIGTFAAQAVATGHVGATALTDRGAASGLYLGAYFSGGLAGSIILGRVYEAGGWPACITAIGVATLLAIALSARLSRVEAASGT